jgi:hypothetical protein
MVQKFWTTCILSIQKIWAGPEILDELYFIHAENLEWSRNSGPVVFHAYRLFWAVQKFWTMCISFLQKIWAFPEVLDQLYYFIHTYLVLVKKISHSNRLLMLLPFFILPELIMN